MLRFSFMLILCDDAQEWGRKSISELYVRQNNRYTYDGIDCDLDGEFFNCKFCDKYEVNANSVKPVIENLKRMSSSYIKVFRDGQDTAARNFNFTRQVEIDVSGANNINYLFKLLVTTTSQTRIEISKTSRENLSQEDNIILLVKSIFKEKESYMSDDSKCFMIIL